MCFTLMCITSKNKRKAKISLKIFYFQFLYLFVICSSFVFFKWTIGLKKIFSTLSNCGFFQYCDSNIWLFFNASHIKFSFFQLWALMWKSIYNPRSHLKFFVVLSWRIVNIIDIFSPHLTTISISFVSAIKIYISIFL